MADLLELVSGDSILAVMPGLPGLIIVSVTEMPFGPVSTIELDVAQVGALGRRLTDIAEKARTEGVWA